MKKPLTDEDLLVRAAIDGRVVFATAAFATAGGLVALLDRVGAPPDLVAVLGPAVAIVGLAIVGVMLRTMRISRFYAGGRAVPPVYAAFAFASLAAALCAPFVPPIAGGPRFAILLGSFAGGLILAAFVGGPLLRKTGAFSVPDLIAARFSNVALRLGVVAVVAAVGLLVGLAGYATAADVLSRATGAPRLAALAMLGLALLLIAAPGGVAGVVWSAAGAAGMLLAGLGLPLAVVVAHGSPLPLPFVGDQAAWSAALARMTVWNNETGPSPGAGLGVMAAIALGVGSLAPILAPAIATRDSGGAQRAGLGGVALCAIIAALAAASMALSTLAFDAATHGVAIEQVPDAVWAASASGGAEICGGHPASIEAARALCGAKTEPPAGLGADAAATGSYLLLGLSDLRGLGGAFSGLAGAGVIAVALALAAAGFQACATALGHDAFYRVRDAGAMTSRRLAVTRLLLGLAILCAGAILARHYPDPRALIGLAIVFCAATVAPLLALSVWPRAEGMDAAAALLAGLASAEILIYWNGGVRSLDGVGQAAVIACAISLATGVAASFVHGLDPTSRGNAFAHGVLRGDADLLHPDKGA